MKLAFWIQEVYLFMDTMAGFLQKIRYFLENHSWFMGHIDELPNSGKVPKFFHRRTQLKETTLVLTSDFASGGYGHYITDCLARLDMFFKVGFDFDCVDHILTPRPTKGSAEVNFECLNITKEKCVCLMEERFS